MKKIIAMLLLLGFVFVGQSFAAEVLYSDTQDGYSLRATSPVNVVIGKTSKGVRLGVTFETTAYALSTVHKSGSRYYGTAWDSTAIYTQAPPGDINAAFTAPATSMNLTAFTDAWAKL